MTQFNWSEPPSQTAFPVAKAGYPFIFASAFATAVFALLFASCEKFLEEHYYSASSIETMVQTEDGYETIVSILDAL